MKFHFQASGSDVVPNKSFWIQLPLLVKVQQVVTSSQGQILIYLCTEIRISFFYTNLSAQEFQGSWLSQNGTKNFQIVCLVVGREAIKLSQYDKLQCICQLRQIGFKLFQSSTTLYQDNHAVVSDHFMPSLEGYSCGLMKQTLSPIHSLQDGFVFTFGPCVKCIGEKTGMRNDYQKIQMCLVYYSRLAIYVYKTDINQQHTHTHTVLSPCHLTSCDIAVLL